MIRYQSPGTGCGRCLVLSLARFILLGLTLGEQIGGKLKPNTAAQSADRKAQKAAWKAKQGEGNPNNDKSQYVSDDEGEDDNAKRKAQQGRTAPIGVPVAYCKTKLTLTAQL